MTDSRGALASPTRLARYLGIERAVAGAMFTMALGEHLWRRFLPKYLEFLLAGAIGMVGTALFSATVEERYAG